MTSLSFWEEELFHPLVWSLIAAIFFIARFLRKYQADKDYPDFDLTDLIVENGKVSNIACAMLGSFLLTSWVIVYLTLNNRVTENYLTIYVGAWVAPIIAKLLKGVSNNKEQGKS